jgi:DNA-binding MarR family transcriptional regulator
MTNIVHEPHHKGDESHLLREIMRAHKALLNVFSRQVGMPASRVALMRLLSEYRSAKIGVMEIARFLGVNAAAVTRQIKEMESEGLVDRVADARDGRRSYVRLTSEGLGVFEHLHERAHQFEQELGSLINSEDIVTAVRVLSQLRVALESLL